MKSLWYKLALVLICTLPLGSCGGGGAPGADNSLQTDVVIESVVLETKDGDKVTPDIDVHIHACPPSFTTSEKGLFRSSVIMKINASKLNKDIEYDPFPASVESCTITFIKANEDPASPVVERTTLYPNCAIISGSIECEMGLMDIQRKIDWWDMFVNGANRPAEYPTHYIPHVQCNYVTRYGKTGTFQSETDIWVADWERC